MRALVLRFSLRLEISRHSFVEMFSSFPGCSPASSSVFSFLSFSFPSPSPPVHPAEAAYEAAPAASAAIAVTLVEIASSVSAPP